jgi:hypothetical protein
MEKYSKECEFCLEYSFTRSVPAYVSGGGNRIYYIDLCINCRLNWWDDDNVCLATTIKHVKRT